MSSGRWKAIEDQAQQIVAELRDGRRSHIIFGELDPELMPRVRAILAGETLPRHENPDD